MSEHDETTDPMEGVEDFDAFWDSQDRKGRKVRVFGEVIELPPSLPLRFEMEAKRLQRSKSDKDITRLLTMLFGEGVMDRWTDRGMDLEQFQVLLAWAPQVIAGKQITLADAQEMVREQEVKQATKKGGRRSS